MQRGMSSPQEGQFWILRRRHMTSMLQVMAWVYIYIYISVYTCECIISTNDIRERWERLQRQTSISGDDHGCIVNTSYLGILINRSNVGTKLVKTRRQRTALTQRRKARAGCGGQQLYSINKLGSNDRTPTRDKEPAAPSHRETCNVGVNRRNTSGVCRPSRGIHVVCVCARSRPLIGERSLTERYCGSTTCAFDISSTNDDREVWETRTHELSTSPTRHRLLAGEFDTNSPTSTRLWNIGWR